jgi:acyl-CoA synthetase (AMP-forming)/AMP-acid ligase II
MLSSATFPEFVFIGPDGAAQSCPLAAEAARIDGIAVYLKQQLPPGSAIGLMLPSGLELVLTWLGAVKAGLQPLVLQYPNKRLARSYWLASIRHTIDLAGLAAVVTTAASSALGLADLIRVVPAETLATLPPGSPEDFVLDDFSIL